MLTITSKDDARKDGLIKYFTGVNCRNGHISERYTQSGACVACIKSGIKRWHKNHPTYSKDYVREYRFREPRYSLLDTARAIAKKTGLPITIGSDDIIIPEFCPCCGRAIVKLRRPLKHQTSSPSLCRIESDIGYFPHNVAVICWGCNEIKRLTTLDHIDAIAKWWRSTLRSSAAAHAGAGEDPRRAGIPGAARSPNQAGQREHKAHDSDPV